MWTDVRDIARIHVLAVETNVAKGQRYLAIAGHFDNAQVVEVLARKMPEETKGRLPKVEEGAKGKEHYKTDSSKVEKELGIEWIGFEQCVVDTAKRLLELEKELGGK